MLYILTVALLVRCRTDSWLESPWTCSLIAGLATALFAVHPLRVNPVAHATAQTYLPCAIFSMLAVLAYLRAFPRDSSPRWGWLVGSFLLFVAALLFLPGPVGLPAVLLILDVYPLRRIPDGRGRWFGASTWRALLEKVPFMMVSVLFMRLAIAARPWSPIPVEYQGAAPGIARACYSVCIYLVETILPVNLVGMYPVPREVNWLAFPYSLCILATLAVSAGLFLLRRCWPGLLAVWLSYLVILRRTRASCCTATRLPLIAIATSRRWARPHWRRLVFPGSGACPRGGIRVPSGWSRLAWERFWA